ncbi:MAG TPA: hypothetical protein VFR87_06900 [Nocardioidaceae bacterium]|nr:hypothetical protein [Nocardioidaceae bacterium]
MRRALAAAAVAALVLTGCAESEEPATSQGTTASESPTASQSTAESESESGETEPETDAIEVEIEGDRIEPNGMRVEVAAGDPVALAVRSDRAAEFHVHSSPEQVLEVEPGESTVELVIDRPGIVDIEEHETGLVVLQLEVR